MKIQTKQISVYIKCEGCNNECSVYYKLSAWSNKDWRCADCFVEALQDNKIFLESINYKKAFDILYEYFDSIADEEKSKVDKKLKRLGL